MLTSISRNRKSALFADKCSIATIMPRGVPMCLKQCDSILYTVISEILIGVPHIIISRILFLIPFFYKERLMRCVTNMKLFMTFSDINKVLYFQLLIRSEVSPPLVVNRSNEKYYSLPIKLLSNIIFDNTCNSMIINRYETIT